MTATEKVLQRNDGATLIVGVVLALAVLQFISSVSQPLTAKIMGNDVQYPDSSFSALYLNPLVWLVLEVVLVEVLVWLVVGVRAVTHPKVVKKKK